MPDVVVCCPMDRWDEWIAEGDLPGEPWSGNYSHFTIGNTPPKITPGERVYIVAHGKVRGYSPLVALEQFRRPNGKRVYDLVRAGGAVAVTIGGTIKTKGFMGFRYRFWEREIEVPFPGWKTP